MFVDLLLRTSNFSDGLDKSNRKLRDSRNQWRRELNNAKSDFGTFGSQIDDVFGSATRSIVGLGGAIGAAFSVNKIKEYSDTFTALESRLGLVTDTTADLIVTQNKLFEIAQNTSQPLSEITGAYVRLSNALTEAQKEQTDMVRITDLLSKTLRISGTNAAGAATFFQQFGQAASSDFKAIGQELGTFADQNPIFYKILQDEARRYGKTLREMGEEGELSFQFITDALTRNAADIEAKNEQIAGTVGQALQRIDNAFLEYIGTSESVREASSSVSLALNYVADNFSEAADLALGLAVVYGARFIPAVVGATTALFSLSGAAAAGASTLAILGGPIGALAVVAALASLALNTDTAAEAQLRYNDVLTDVVTLTDEYKNATLEAQGPIMDAIHDRTQSLRDEREELRKTIESYTEFEGLAGKIRKAYSVGRQEFLSWFGLAESPEDVLERYEKIGATLDKIGAKVEDTRAKLGADRPSLPKLGGDNDKLAKEAEKAAREAEREAKRVQDELARKYEKNRSLIEGIDQATIDYKDTQMELNELYMSGKIGLDEYAAAMQRLDEKFAENSKQASKWGFDIEELGKEAARNLQSTFADFLFDPFEDGLQGMLKGFIDVIRRMIAEAAAAAIIKAIFSAATGTPPVPTGGGGGGFGGFFADGGRLAPGQWGVVGEAGPEIIRATAAGTEITPMVSGSAMGGTTINIDARGAEAGVEEKIRAAVADLEGRVPNISISSVRNARLRNPALFGGGAR